MVGKVNVPRVALIVARSTPGHVIGQGNQLPWRLTSDLRRFKALTTGHVIVMGRKTYESIGRPLPNRTTIVISRRPPAKRDTPDSVLWAGDVDAALRLADRLAIEVGRDTVFVGGGGEIYSLFLNKGLVDRVYLTEVIADIAGDALFPQAFPAKDWRVLETSETPAGAGDDFASRFVVYERKGKSVRTPST